MEYRLYYDDQGKVICYTCELLPGNHILIDRMTFAQARPDIRVIGGKVVNEQKAIISKLIPSVSGKTICATDDISIVLEKNENVATTCWELLRYEL